jgi:hypothetical protein
MSLLADLPLFVDPFLLFHSKKPKYRALHDRMIDYLRFLKQKSELGNLDADLLDAWYRFAEIKQNWLGFAGKGNQRRGLGRAFATALNENLGKIFGSFGNETVTKGSHLENSASSGKVLVGTASAISPTTSSWNSSRNTLRRLQSSTLRGKANSHADQGGSHALADD